MTERDKRRFQWLDQTARGWTPSRIASRACVSVQTVIHELAAAKLARDADNGRPLIFVPDLDLFFPINGLFRTSRCRCTSENHEEGSTLTCAVCHRCGLDGHPGLQRDARTDPKRERTPPAVAKTHHVVTRKERRKSAHQASRVA